MIEFGKTLREAREAKGYSVRQLSEITRIMTSVIEDLERENFSKIVAPIYGRGFVKLYCEAVGLDPKPLVAEFMEILNGNRMVSIKERPVAEAPAPAAPEEPAIRERPAAPVPPPPPAPAPAVEEPIASEPPPVEPLSRPKPLSRPEPPAPDVPQTPDVPPAPDEIESAPTPRVANLSRYATPLREREAPVRPSFRLPTVTLPKIPPHVWRIALLVVVALGILVALSFGVRALYRATSGQPTPRTEAPVAAAPAPAAKPSAPAAKPSAPAAKPAPAKASAPAAPAAPRTPQKIPPLYLD